VNDEKHFLKDFAEKLIYPEVEIARATTRLFPWYVADQSMIGKENLTPEETRALQLSDDYTATLLDDAFQIIFQVVDTIIPNPTWDVWEIKCLGKDLFLNKLEDYRIKDWERRNSIKK
jgi:hypothetical protein